MIYYFGEFVSVLSNSSVFMSLLCASVVSHGNDNEMRINEMAAYKPHAAFNFCQSSQIAM